ncbi:MAG: putative inorganic carbon transporter subunit DabA, partial [Halonotius sp.]
QPLRLSTVVHAPVENVEEILADHDELTTLLDNDWLSLTVVDPTQEHQAFHYESELSWSSEPEREATSRPEAEPAAPTAAGDD